MGQRTTLGSGEIFEIVSDGVVARCTVVNRPDVGPDVGARCAGEMDRILTGQVLSAQSSLSGMVFDVRRGPPVFGPKTRATLERMFALAEREGKRIVVRVGDVAIQKLQFSSLCTECAPRCARVATTDAEEDWAAG